LTIQKFDGGTVFLWGGLVTFDPISQLTSRKTRSWLWSGGQVVRWSGGQVVRWSGDCITVKNFGKVFPFAKGHTTAKPSMWF